MDRTIRGDWLLWWIWWVNGIALIFNSPILFTTSIGFGWLMATLVFALGLFHRLKQPLQPQRQEDAQP